MQLVVFGATISAVLAPQADYLRQCSRNLPALSVVGLNLLYGTLVGMLLLYVIRANRGHWPPPVGSKVMSAIALLSLPFYSLWLPWLSATEARETYVTATTLIAVLIAGSCLITALQSGRCASMSKIVTFLVATMIGMLTSHLLAHLATNQRFFFSASLVWGLYLLAAFVGWGTVVNRVLLQDRSLDWGQRAAWGLAAAVAVGGVLNLTWSVSRPIVLFFLALGIGAFCSNLRSRTWRFRDWARRLDDPITILLMVLVISLAAVQFSGSLAGTVSPGPDAAAFDQHDDSQAYLVFPKKMMELGSMGPEPFEPRRMLSLGGQSFLQVLVLVTLPMRALHIIDGGVALLILIGLMSGAARRLGISRRLTIFLMLLVLAFPHAYMRESTSSLLTGVVLIVSWFRLYADNFKANDSGWTFACLTALTASSLCVLKSTYIPVAIVFFAVSTTAHIANAKGRRANIKEAATTLGLTSLLVLPWMISMYESSGTLLYPVLGSGFYGGVFTDDFASITGSFGVSLLAYLQTIWKHLLRLLLVFLLLFTVRDSTPRRPAFSLVAAVVVGVIALVVLGDPNLDRALIRLGFGLAMAAFLGLSLEACRGSGMSTGPSRGMSPSTAAAFAIGALFILHSQGAIRGMYYDMLRNAATALAGPTAVAPSDIRLTAEIEAVLPTGGSVLTTLRHPYLLKNDERQVMIMSLPGMAGLPPGLPIDRGSDAVAEYLLGHDIRYLAYGGMGDLEDLLDLTEEDIRARYPASKTRWVMLRYHQRYRHVVRELAATRKRLYFDGRTVVLDLAESVSTLVGEKNSESSGVDPNS
jgi:hypothetical protein